MTRVRGTVAAWLVLRVFAVRATAGAAAAEGPVGCAVPLSLAPGAVRPSGGLGRIASLMRRPVQVRRVHPGRGAGPGGLRSVLAQGAERQAADPEIDPGRYDASGRAQAR